MARRCLLLLLTLCVCGLWAAAPAATSAQHMGRAARDAAAPIAFSAMSLDFGAQRVAMSGTVQMVMLTNNLTATLTITGVTIAGADASDFAETDSCAGQSIQPGATCGIGVGFTPTVAGSRAATLLVADSAADSPQSVALLGLGAMPSLNVSASSLDFGTQAVDSSGTPRMLTLTNSSMVTLTITTTVITSTNPADFDEADNCVGAVLPPQGTCSVSLTFSPQDTGSRAASLQIVDDAPDSPQSIALTGNGSDSGVSVTPGGIDFGAQQGGSGASRTITVANNGAAPLSIDGVTISSDGDFAETDTCSGATIQPGGSCALNVTFTPLSNGPTSGSIIILDDAPDSPQVISVMGNGYGLPTATPTETYTPTASLSGTATITATPPLSAAVALTPTVTVTPSAPPALTAPTPAATTGGARPHHAPVVQRAKRRQPRLARRLAHARRSREHGSAVEHHMALFLLPGRAVALTIDVHTRPRARLSVTVQVTTKEPLHRGSRRHPRVTMRDVPRFRDTISGVADAHGRYSGRVYVTYQPPRPLWAELTISERIAQTGPKRLFAPRATARQASAPSHSSTRRLTMRLTPDRAVALLVGLHTAPRWRVSISVEVLTRETTTVGVGRHRHRITRLLARFRGELRGRADAHGSFSGRVWITYRPPRPVQATIVIRSLATRP